MTIKYEPVFGDQSLFDNAPEDAEYAGWFCQEIRWYTILNGKILFSDGGTWCTSDNPYLSADIAALRRIIKTPTWSRADQEAGVLPPVGAEAIWGYHRHKPVVLVLAALDEMVAVEYNGSLEVMNVEVLSPIETPAEKAQREEDEFVESTCRQNEPHSTLYSDGVRAAYRKLKGGE